MKALNEFLNGFLNESFSSESNYNITDGPFEPETIKHIMSILGAKKASDILSVNSNQALYNKSDNSKHVDKMVYNKVEKVFNKGYEPQVAGDDGLGNIYMLNKKAGIVEFQDRQYEMYYFWKK